MSIGDLVKIYGPNFDFPRRDAAPQLTFQIATTARTGSTLLAMDLWRSGLAAPFEYLNRPYMGQLMTRLDSQDFETYWPRLQRLRSDRRGIFGVKIFFPHFNLWDVQTEIFSEGVLPQFTIFLDREDKVAQAVSLSRAVQTQAWAKGAVAQRAPQYNFEHIHARLEAMAQQEADWHAFFRRTGTTPLTLSYEAYLADRQGACERVANHLSVPLIPFKGAQPPTVESQSDELNAEWIALFRRDLERGRADSCVM